MDELPLELVPEPTGRPPRLPGAVVFHADVDRVVDSLLADLIIHASNCVRTFGDFQLAISPGPGLEPALRRLMFDLPYREFPWARTRLWLTDERDLAPEHPERRSSLLRDLVAIPSGIPEEQVHYIDASGDDDAARFEGLLREHLGWREKGHDRLDFVLLDLAPGGTVAGIQAGDPGVSEDGPLAYRIARSGAPARATMSLRLINAARLVAVGAMGDGARPALADVRSVAGAPARQLRPVGGDLRWYVDAAASPAD